MLVPRPTNSNQIPAMTLRCIVTFLLLFNILEVYSETVQYCPDRCVCDKDTVQCLHLWLTSVPTIEHHGLKKLDLRFNKIQEIPPKTFNRLENLKSLLLNDNNLQVLRSGMFDGLRRLVYLYLYRNRIRTIEDGVFNDMEDLEQLYLHVNELHQISPDTFANLPKLERLYLDNNHLTSIPDGSFRTMPRLQKLRLDHNALVCDCNLRWLVRMLAEHTDMEATAICYGPGKMTGTALQRMTENDFNCSVPKITEEPQDALVPFGEDAMFSCKVSGEPAPEIVWLYDDSMIVENSRYEIMGNGSLMVHNADEKDKGYFECMAKNTVGEARSKAARVLVQNMLRNEEQLEFTRKPIGQIAKLGEKVSFDCQATGKPRPHIIWFFNGERFLLDDRINIQHNGTISIADVDLSDAGEFKCQAENIDGKIQAIASLKVLGSPIFTVVPQDKSVIFGDTVEFNCKAKGIPTPEVGWYRHSEILLESSHILIGDNGTTLTILEVTREDAGMYHCRAKNTQGLTETQVNLQVNEPIKSKPVIVSKPEDTESFRETTVQLSCEFESDVPATVEWRKNGARLYSLADLDTEEDRIYISLVGNLIIKNVTVLDTGNYECSVFNEYGRDTAAATLIVKQNILPSDEYVNIALTEAARDVDQAITRTVEQIFNNDSAVTDIHHMFRLSRFPNAPARDIARAAEVYERTLDIVQNLIKSGQKANSTEPFNYNFYLSPKHLDLIARLSGCTAHREQENCTDMCHHLKYRSIDGSCNNLHHPMWGSSLTGFRRLLSPIYENGFSQPVGWNKDVKYNSYTLPSARLVSTSIIKTEEISEDSEITHMTMQWGQWLDHDLDHALPAVSSQTWDGIDCKKTCDYAAPCFPIDVPPSDPRITNRRCIDFFRTSSVCGSGMTSVLFGKLQPREQINQLTSFLDASQVYGFQKDVALDLRDLTNENGQLREGVRLLNSKPLLPTGGLNAMDCRRNLDESTKQCFVAGDIRANEQIGLAAMHTIFMREHNRIATELKNINPTWRGDTIYHEARKVVGAEMQYITYEHWLPLIVGPEGYRAMGQYKGYDPSLNPSVSNVFATAALRFGHSLINPVLHRYDENFETIPQGHLQLHHAFFSPWRLDEGGVDPLLRGMFTTPAKLKTPTQNLNTELTERLFETAHAVALDLAAINIQRGRDHAIPPYTQWREVCNMTAVHSFDDLVNEISNAEVREKLKQLYGSPHNIDVWVGGIMEDQVEGGKVGPLFRCLLIEQFKRLRDGDRFWYENTAIFKAEQVREIKKTSLARILCDNGDNIDTINENVFLLPELQGGLAACEDLQGIDFRYWVHCESCEEDEPRRFRRHTRKDNTNTVADKERQDKIERLENNQTLMQKVLEDLMKRVTAMEANKHI